MEKKNIEFKVVWTKEGEKREKYESRKDEGRKVEEGSKGWSRGLEMEVEEGHRLVWGDMDIYWTKDLFSWRNGQKKKVLHAQWTPLNSTIVSSTRSLLLYMITSIFSSVAWQPGVNQPYLGMSEAIYPALHPLWGTLWAYIDFL